MPPPEVVTEVRELDRLNELTAEEERLQNELAKTADDVKTFKNLHYRLTKQMIWKQKHHNRQRDI